MCFFFFFFLENHGPICKLKNSRTARRFAVARRRITNIVRTVNVGIALTDKRVAFDFLLLAFVIRSVESREFFADFSWNSKEFSKFEN